LNTGLEIGFCDADSHGQILQSMVKAREVAQLGQGSVDCEESGIALAPILFALVAFMVAWRYIARARGDLDADVLSSILVGVLMVARLAFGRLLKSCHQYESQP
jgi:hypothetical protein